MSSPWFRMDQLLKCSICSGKYRNPKLLPCNHTFCSEPCLERLVERSKQQLKCPECSAEHRVPHGSIQSFPNNVTLVRFLELRQQVSGREPELPPSMQRCNTCKEKGHLDLCAHCNRKVCKDCKTAHVNILRKEIALINDQVRQGLKHLSGILHKTEENVDKIQKNYSQVKDEIEEVVRRYNRDLYDTDARLKHDLDIYLQSELKSMQKLEHDLQVELMNVNSNCDLVDKHVNNGVDWTDVELTEYKDIFLKTLDFLRAFDSDPTDCIRKIKFHPRADPDVVHKTLQDFAEVKLNQDINSSTNSGGVNDTGQSGSGPTLTLSPPQNNLLSRSQSDNRLANQKQSKSESGRILNDDVENESIYGRVRYTRGRAECEERDNMRYRDDRSSGHLSVPSRRRDLDDTRDTGHRGRFSSREYIDDIDSYEKESSPGRRSGVRFDEKSADPLQRIRDHVVETEDATKGPLSGVIKIFDSPHVMERLHHSEVRQKKMKEEEERKARQPPPPPPRVNRPMNRQLSEDEIEKQKKENKAAAAAAALPNSTLNSSSPGSKVQTPLRDSYTRTRQASKDDDSRPTSRTSSYNSYESDKTSNFDSQSNASRRIRDEDKSSGRLKSWRNSTTDANHSSYSPPGSPTSHTRESQKPPVSPRNKDTATRLSGRPYLEKNSSLTQEDRQESSPPLSQRRPASTGLSVSIKDEPRSRTRPGISAVSNAKAEESSESSSSDNETETDSETAAKRGDISPSVNTLLERSAQARRQSASTQARLLGQKDDDLRKKSPRNWRESIKKDDDKSKDSILPPRRRVTTTEPEERTSQYNSILSDRRRSSLVTPPRFRSRRDDSPEDRTRANDSSYSAHKTRIARSKSSHDLFPAEDSPEDDSITSIRNRYKTRKSTTRDKSPEDASSTWSQYLKNKYGTGRISSSSGINPISRSRTSAALAPRSGSDNSSEEDRTTPPRRGDYRRHSDNLSPHGFSLPRRTYMIKGKPAIKIGTRGTEQGRFTWPRGVCVGQENAIVVADSSNHRIQVFHPSGRFLQEFGSYGSNDGEFDCLAAVTVNRIGQFIVSDRYNHRVQVFDPSGRFVRSFGSEGRGDGKFSYPWGIATDNLGFIYVCDKENHRVQVFQGDGTYVTKFGGIGQRPGELEHPHYIAVSSTNRVIVSDSNNHRIQIFDVNGRLLTTFGTEGSDEGQFKYPRGVAVDDQGYIIVGDSGNNRIQVFHPDGTFLKAFGTWGAADGEFKGLEGVAVSSTGQIFVCDRENHRIQIF